MRKVKINGATFEIRKQKEITYEAVEETKELPTRLMMQALNLQKYQKLIASGATEETVWKKAYSDMFADPVKMARFVRLQNADEVLVAVSLVTNLDYDEVKKLPHTTVMELLERAKEEIGTPIDFLNGLDINIAQNAIEATKTMKGMTKA